LRSFFEVLDGFQIQGIRSAAFLVPAFHITPCDPHDFGVEIRDKQAILDDAGKVVVAGVVVFSIGGSYLEIFE
jgi:hypothetical protein